MPAPNFTAVQEKQLATLQHFGICGPGLVVCDDERRCVYCGEKGNHREH